MLRFHLLALKGSAVILLRLGRIDDARARLQSFVDLDADDPLDAASIPAVVDAAGDDAAPLPIAAWTEKEKRHALRRPGFQADLEDLPLPRISTTST